MNPIPDASSMNDSEFNSLLRNARRAAARLDFSREEYGFATRMHQIAATTAPDLRPVQLLRYWATAAAATATLAGITAAFTMSTAQIRDREDALAGFWDSGATLWNDSLVR
jgi:hypothetical protein